LAPEKNFRVFRVWWEKPYFLLKKGVFSAEKVLFFVEKTRFFVAKRCCFLEDGF